MVCPKKPRWQIIFRREICLGAAVYMASVLFFFPGCNKPSTEPIEISRDSCHHCKMTIIDGRYGAEIVTKKGKVYKFDSIDCLVNFVRSVGMAEIDGIYLLDFNSPGRLIDSASARFVISNSRNTPMGTRFVAVESQAAAGLPQPSMSWEELLRSIP